MSSADDIRNVNFWKNSDSISLFRAVTYVEILHTELYCKVFQYTKNKKIL
jgi:hypothetical protein